MYYKLTTRNDYEVKMQKRIFRSRFKKYLITIERSQLFGTMSI